MKYTIYFNKLGYIKFISHLDLIRVFKRAFKRADVQLKFSQGYNPHPKMAFAQPLSLGYSSICEILDIETKIDYLPENISKLLNSNLPKGLSVTKCVKREENYKGIGNKISEAGYRVEIFDCNFISKEIIDDFLSKDEIIVYKRQKKKKELKEVNIKPQIRKVDFTKKDEDAILDILIDCGSVSNLSPELFLKGLSSFLEKDILTEDVEITRTYLG